MVQIEVGVARHTVSWPDRSIHTVGAHIFHADTVGALHLLFPEAIEVEFGVDPETGVASCISTINNKGVATIRVGTQLAIFVHRIGEIHLLVVRSGHRTFG